MEINVESVRRSIRVPAVLIEKRAKQLTATKDWSTLADLCQREECPESVKHDFYNIGHLDAKKAYYDSLDDVGKLRLLKEYGKVGLYKYAADRYAHHIDGFNEQLYGFFKETKSVGAARLIAAKNPSVNNESVVELAELFAETPDLLCKGDLNTRNTAFSYLSFIPEASWNELVIDNNGWLPTFALLCGSVSRTSYDWRFGSSFSAVVGKTTLAVLTCIDDLSDDQIKLYEAGLNVLVDSIRHNRYSRIELSSATWPTLQAVQASRKPRLNNAKNIAKTYFSMINRTHGSASTGVSYQEVLHSRLYGANSEVASWDTLHRAKKQTVKKVEETYRYDPVNILESIDSEHVEDVLNNFIVFARGASSTAGRDLVEAVGKNDRLCQALATERGVDLILKTAAAHQSNSWGHNRGAVNTLLRILTINPSLINATLTSFTSVEGGRYDRMQVAELIITAAESPNRSGTIEQFLEDTLAGLTGQAKSVDFWEKLGSRFRDTPSEEVISENMPVGLFVHTIEMRSQLGKGFVADWVSKLWRRLVDEGVWDNAVGVISSVDVNMPVKTLMIVLDRVKG